MRVVAGFAWALEKAREELVTREHAVFDLDAGYLPYVLVAVPMVDDKLDPFRPLRVVAVAVGATITADLRVRAGIAREFLPVKRALLELWCYDLKTGDWKTEGLQG